MFNYEDLNELLNTVVAMEEPEATLEAWGIDNEGFNRFLRDGAIASLKEIEDLDDVGRVATEMMVGFFLGYQTALEIQLRELTKKEV